MRKILILGAGQAGLQAAISLQRLGYAVTLISDRSPDQVREGPVLSSQCMFNSALETERAAEINLWEADTPKIEAIDFCLGTPEGRPAIQWQGGLDRYALSVDQRLKFPALMDMFCRLGGRLLVEHVDRSRLAARAKGHDLVLISTGKAGADSISDDASSGPPQRKLSLAYVHGFEPPPGPDSVRFNIVPGEGELFVMPCLTLSGPAHILFWEAIPGGALDVFGKEPDPARRLQLSLTLMERWCPWLLGNAKNVELTDANATLTGAVTPHVRSPVFEFADGRFGLRMSDAVVLNDPITGQGANSAAKCASLYVREIVAQGDREFTKSWMKRTFACFEPEASAVARWTNEVLTPPKPHVVDLMAAAAHSPGLARKIANGFDDPKVFESFYFDPAATSELIQRHLAKGGSRLD